MRTATPLFLLVNDAKKHIGNTFLNKFGGSCDVKWVSCRNMMSPPDLFISWSASLLFRLFWRPFTLSDVNLIVDWLVIWVLFWVVS
ncbi:hypothetical protein FKM82_018059 [Ascaphus truei]